VQKVEILTNLDGSKKALWNDCCCCCEGMKLMVPLKAVMKFSALSVSAI